MGFAGGGLGQTKAWGLVSVPPTEKGWGLANVGPFGKPGVSRLSGSQEPRMCMPG